MQQYRFREWIGQKKRFLCALCYAVTRTGDRSLIPAIPKLPCALAALCAGILIDRFASVRLEDWRAMMRASFLLAFALLLLVAMFERLCRFGARRFGTSPVTRCPVARFPVSTFTSKRIQSFFWRICSSIRFPSGAMYSCASVAFVSLFAFGWFSLGGLVHHCRWNVIQENDLVRFATQTPQPIIVSGTVTSSLRPSLPSELAFSKGKEQKRCSFDLDVEAIKRNGQWVETSGRVFVSATQPAKKFGRGEKVIIYGSFSRFSPVRNFGAVNFANIYRRRGILTRIQANEVTQTSATPLNERGPSRNRKLARTLENSRFKLSRSFEDILEDHLTGHEQRFAKALLLGDAAQLARHEKQKYLQTGTVHVLAISGLHIGFVVWPFYAISRLSYSIRRIALLVGIAFAIWFCWLTGYKPPVIRATTLVAICWGAKLVSRRSSNWRNLQLAAISILLINPTSLFAPGAHLSFIAVATLFGMRQSPPAPLHCDQSSVSEQHQELISPSLTSAILRRFFGLAFQVGKSCSFLWLTSLPIVAGVFHVCTPIAIVVNAFAIPLVGAIMLSGFSLLLLGILDCPLASTAAYMFSLSFRFFDMVVDWGTRTPGASFEVRGPPFWWIILSYSLGLLFLGFRSRPKARKRFLSLLILLCFWLPIRDLAQDLIRSGIYSKGETECVVIDVGHGTAILFRFPNGQTLLYDCGSLSGGTTTSRKIQLTLWHFGILHLDGVILSHADIDHFNAIVLLSEKVSIGTIFVEPSMLRHTNGIWLDSLKVLKEREISIRSLVTGDQCATGPDSLIHVAHPPPSLREESDNERSIAISVTHQSSSILLTGDLESSGLKRLFDNRFQEESHKVLLAPHHGSPSTPVRSVLENSKPQLVVISGARNSKSASTAGRYQADGASVLATYDVGAIAIWLGTDSIRFRSKISREGETRILKRGE